jgi:lipoprotein NlpD
LVDDDASVEVMNPGRVSIVIVALVLLHGCGGHDALAPVANRAAAQQTPPAYYKVRRGDTLFSIAFRYGLDYRRVAGWNRIRAPYTIYPGQKVRLRPRVRNRAPGERNKHSAPGRTQRNQSKARSSARSTKPPPPSASSRQNSPPRSHSGIKWQWPTRGAVVRTFSSTQPGRKGIDISGRQGQAIRAAASGRVVYAGSGLLGYGKLIIVKHNDVYLSAYAHNRRLFVREGQRVKAGQRIAEMGRSGTDSVKLHFEIRRDGKPVNPKRYLP